MTSFKFESLTKPLDLIDVYAFLDIMDFFSLTPCLWVVVEAFEDITSLLIIYSKGFSRRKGVRFLWRLMCLFLLYVYK